jgi:predicted aldo/keto reductase-like oxidoreductase
MPAHNKSISPGFSRKYNEARVYGLWEPSRRSYQAWQWVQGKPADACIECANARPRARSISTIREQLREAHEALKAK